MTKLEEIRPGSRITGLVSDTWAEVISVQRIGDQAVNVVYRSAGNIAESLLYRDDEQRLDTESAGTVWSLDADGELLRLVTEAHRIRLACFFDPYLAVHISQVESLPHQITAVYEEMLERQPLRFLLADDPGAGKTIMAGLLIKELAARSDLERCLVVAPGNLVEQWQDELGGKFNLEFEILTRDMTERSRSGTPFNDHGLLIARLDMLARNEHLQAKLAAAAEWDLVIVDEAHRMSASYTGNEVRRTKRYELGEKLSGLCRHLLLMTATPHNGKEEDFQLFMGLLDGDRFEGSFRGGVGVAEVEDMMRRLTKEELLTFDGRPLFPERRAYTVRYELSVPEAALYTSVTEYVRNEMNRVRRFAAGGRRRNNVGFALQTLQRRLASSPAAIYQSLRRRRKRLEEELSSARLGGDHGREAAFNTSAPTPGEFGLDEIDELAQDEAENLENLIAARSTASRTVEQLAIEVKTLVGLEQQAQRVLRSSEDSKWLQLSRVLDMDEMVGPDGHRRKLIIFTEARETLLHLRERVAARLGRPEAVDVIHGGVTREDRRKVVERFMQDTDLLVLLANDAAGEGVNLQRGHLMVNYDLPWNPNKIEQRFGRIHRIGQTEVCHLWNLVATGTREGDVYARLLDKLEIARKALGGRVYDVLGELFDERPLSNLLFDAIEYGEQEDVKAKLLQVVDGAVDESRLLELLRRRQLTDDAIPEDKVHELRLEMERAEAQRLQPHHIQSFFEEAMMRLGGRVRERESGRFEVASVPLAVLRRDRQSRVAPPLQRRYERICFEKSKVHQQPVAEFIYPGHPLLDGVVGVVCEQHGHLMKQGAVMVDDTDEDTDVAALCLLEHSVQDGRRRTVGTPNVISRRLQFTRIDKHGNVANAGMAPHLNLRAATPAERDSVADVLQADWVRSEVEGKVQQFATVELAQSHLAEVRARRLPEIDRISEAVHARLHKEINYWDARALELRDEESAGKKTALSSLNATRRAEELAERLSRRTDVIEQERLISALPPRILGGMIVVPIGLLRQRMPPDTADPLTTDPLARRKIECAAMEAVMAVERELGNEPNDVSLERIGYDIESYDRDTGSWRFIEVKGRVEGASTLMVTRQEIIVSLHEPDKYILAVVLVGPDSTHRPRYVRRHFTKQPDFGVTAVQVKLQTLLDAAEDPA